MHTHYNIVIISNFLWLPIKVYAEANTGQSHALEHARYLQNDNYANL